MELKDYELDYDCVPSYWRRMMEVAASQSRLALSDAEEAAWNLRKEYVAKGYIASLSFMELLETDDLIWLLFYAGKLQERAIAGRPQSEADCNASPKWMLERDYCFLNIRAIGKDVSETGCITDAVKILPALRVSGIHLAPFFECDHGIVYCQKSFYRINPEIVNYDYRDHGVSADEQMQFFLDCAHLLHMAVGFDVTAHTSAFSKLSMDRPELFRWVRLNQKKDGLHHQMESKEQYTEAYQCKMATAIREIVQKEYRANGIHRVDDARLDRGESDRIFQLVAHKVRKAGYFAVPPHAWNGAGLPEFKRYCRNTHRVTWEFLDLEGQSQSQHAIPLHASLYFHCNMVGNQLPQTLEEAALLKTNEVALRFFTAYLLQMIETYGFDFIRMDYVDHIFDNIVRKQGLEYPIYEALLPSEIQQMMEEIHKKHPGIGLQADHLGADIEDYGSAGFQLITGWEVGLKYVRNNMSEVLRAVMTQAKGSPMDGCRSTFAVDTHDMAHPLFLGKELAYREGVIGTLNRLMISRFLNVGAHRRPKYEVIGNQDMSAGIHRANNRPESLHWVSNRKVYLAYHAIEDLYASMREQLRECHFSKYVLAQNHVVAQLECEGEEASYLCIFPTIPDETYIDNQGGMDARLLDETKDHLLLHFVHEIHPPEVLLFATLEDLSFSKEASAKALSLFAQEDSLQLNLRKRLYAVLKVARK